MVLTNCKGYLRECVATCRGELPSYGQSSGYRSSQQQMPSDALVSGHLSLEPLWFAGPFLPYEVTDVMDALGISELDGVSFALTTQGASSLSVAHIGLKGPKSGVVRSVLGRPASFSSAQLCPSETLFYATLSIDPEEVMASVSRVLDSLPPEVSRDVRRELVHEIDSQLRPVGLSLEELCSMVGLFGPELTLAVTTPGSASLQPEMIAMIDVVDTDAAQRVVDSALQEADVPDAKLTSYKETEVRYWNAFKGSPVPYRPALAYHDGKLIVASSARTVKSTLARAVGKRKSLADQEDFARTTQQAHGASAVAMLRLNSAGPSPVGHGRALPREGPRRSWRHRPRCAADARAAQ